MLTVYTELLDNTIIPRYKYQEMNLKIRLMIVFLTKQKT